MIDPFNKNNLANTSYDVRLGKYFYRQAQIDRAEILNPFWEKSVRKLYSEVQEAVLVSKIKSQDNPFYNLNSNDKIILVAPGETILAHTFEFIGGRNTVTSEMRARSSMGRLGIAVCKCAGWGDIGYVNRWTMEITNFSNVIIPLPVGVRIAQIIFHEVEAVSDREHYHKLSGKYQTSHDMTQLKKNWKPEDMLPKLYKDPDLGEFRKYI